jgi:uncharacterized membrane protein
MATLGPNKICALTLSFIALTDIFIAFDIPILRQLFGFALLTFLPGFLLIQILKLTSNLVEKMLILVGLSICFLMFVPLAMNFTYPTLGISPPLSLSTLTITFSLILAALSLVGYWKVPAGFQFAQKDVRVLIDRIMSPVGLGAALILVLGILGALFVRFYSNSFFSLLSWLSIAISVVLLITSRRIPERFYPLFVFIIALTLQYNHTLTSQNLFGIDAHYELYLADVVKSSGYWDPSFAISNLAYSDYSAMLSVVILPNVYSILLSIDLVWVFKLVSPFIFAFIPLGLYEIYKTQIKFSNKAAFLSTFLFISFFAFYLAMPSITRQEVAELFVVLVILVITSKYVPESKKAALVILFIGGVVVSHYATSYIFLFYLVALLTGSAIIASQNRQIRDKSIVSAVIVFLAVVITFAWYLFASAGTPYQSLVLVVSHTYSSLSNQFVSPNAAVLGGATSGYSLSQLLSHDWQIVTEALIVIGLGFVIWRRKTQKMTTIPLLLSLTSFAILLILIFVPSLGSAIGAYRAYSVALLFLAPCCVLGVEAIVDTTSSWLHADKDTVTKLKAAALIGVFVPYFLLQCGFIAELTENPSNYAFLSSPNQNQRALNYCDTAAWSYAVVGPIPVESVYASQWLSNSMGKFPVYADLIRASELVGYGNISPNSIGIFQANNINRSVNSAYIYLGAANVQSHSITLKDVQPIGVIPVSTVPALTGANRIYSNGLAEVYFHT